MLLRLNSRARQPLGRLAVAIAKLAPDKREAVKSIVEERVASFSGDDGLAVSGLVHVVAAD